MDSVASTASGNYSTGEIQTFPAGARVGSVQISTSASFNGSTTTAAFQGSNDGTTWSTVYQDDNETAMTFTLSSGENSYVWILKVIAFSQYRIVYTKGNASAGTVKALMNTN